MPERNAPTHPQTSDPVVIDPDDFNRTQRFKEIHDARQRVSEYVATVEKHLTGEGYKHEPGTAPTFVHEQLAFRVALYIMELEPLLARKEGDDPYMSRYFPENSAVDNLHSFAFQTGLVRSGESGETDGGKTKTRALPARASTSLRVFQVANRAYANLGMDLEIAEESGDAGFDYSDILEEGPPEGNAPQLETGGSDEEGNSDE